jgi:hypothetical protein
MKASKIFVVGALSFISVLALSQAAVRKLPQIINRPSLNITAPFISLDGNTLLFTSDYIVDEPSIYFSQREQANWNEPKMLPKHINNKLNFSQGYTLSADGKLIYITTNRSGGVGGFDIWAGNLLGNSVNDLQNVFAPINSKMHEGCPTFTPDGMTMYFMRCEQMNYQKADKCKIMVTRKGANGRWQEPEELPSHINTGNSQTPRIGADGVTLIFASNVLQPNRGGMDLYVSKWVNGAWSAPVPLDNINTEQDDQFVSFTANGRYLLKDAPGQFKRELQEILFPENLRPKPVMRLEGIITDAQNNLTPAYISVTELQTNTRVYTGRPDKSGNYFLYLKVGSLYELSVDPEDDHYTFFSKTIDLTQGEAPLVQKINAILKPLEDGDDLELSGLHFKPSSSELVNARFELSRLARLIRSAPDFLYELQVTQRGYRESSELLDSDLTEMATDTLKIKIIASDSLTEQDSIIVNTKYHNNRTEKQALAIIDQLVSLGINPESLTYTTNALPEPAAGLVNPEIRVRVRKR